MSETSKTDALEAELEKDFPLRDTGDPQHRIAYLTEALKRYKQLASGTTKETPKPDDDKPSGTRVYRR